MREKEAARRYLLELLGSVAVYTALLVAALTFGEPMQPGLWRILVLASPMLGFGLMFWALVRQYRRMDEFIRRLFLENATMAAAVTVGLTFTYGFLEVAGYPKLSMFSVWMLMGASWGAIALVRGLCHR